MATFKEHEEAMLTVARKISAENKKHTWAMAHLKVTLGGHFKAMNKSEVLKSMGYKSMSKYLDSHVITQEYKSAYTHIIKVYEFEMWFKKNMVIERLSEQLDCVSDTFTQKDGTTRTTMACDIIGAEQMGHLGLCVDYGMTVADFVQWATDLNKSKSVFTISNRDAKELKKSLKDGGTAEESHSDSKVEDGNSESKYDNGISSETKNSDDFLVVCHKVNEILMKYSDQFTPEENDTWIQFTMHIEKKEEQK